MPALGAVPAHLDELLVARSSHAQLCASVMAELRRQSKSMPFDIGVAASTLNCDRVDVLAALSVLRTLGLVRLDTAIGWTIAGNGEVV